jgi:membrane dipeptidase
MRRQYTSAFLFCPLFVIGCSVQPRLTDEQLHAKAEKLAHQFIIVDTHIDLPERLADSLEDISQRIKGGDFDYVRARQGGLDAPFMAIFTSADEEAKGTARGKADTLIDLIESFVKKWPEKFALAKSPADVTENFGKGKMSLPMGMENGAPIEGKMENLQHFYDRGIRYLTLCHARNNHVCDSSFDTTRTWYGLSHFGKRLIPELNRLGIMVDVSHISDDAFYQVMEISKAPVIASHSSCRAFIPGLERNIPDEMIKLLAKNDGVVMINFGSIFLNKECEQAWNEEKKEISTYLHAHNLNGQDSTAKVFFAQYWHDHPLPLADVKDVAMHIDHVAKLVGIEHVGIGSDFDGMGDNLPTGLRDVSMYPNLVYELLKFGYSDEDIKKVCGENLLRVWSKVEQVAKKLQKGV